MMSSKAFTLKNIIKNVVFLKPSNLALIRLHKRNQISSKISEPNKLNEKTNIQSTIQSINLEKLCKSYLDLRTLNDLNFDDYKVILETLFDYKIFPRSIHEDHLIHVKLLTIYRNILFDSKEQRLFLQLINNPHNWSVFVECLKAIKRINIDELGIFDKDFIKKTNEKNRKYGNIIENISLEDFDLFLMKGLNVFQTLEIDKFIDSIKISENISENFFINFEKINRLNNSLVKKVKNNMVKWKNEKKFEILSLDNECNNLKILALKNKHFIKIASNTGNNTSKKYLDAYRAKMNSFLQRHPECENPSSDEINLLKLFRFNEEKNDFFSKLSSKQGCQALILGLEGAIYQNNLNHFHILTEKLFPWNCSHIEKNLNFKHGDLFKQFLILRAKCDPSITITALMKAWNNYHYIPTEETITDLKMFIDQLKQSDSVKNEWRVRNVNISNKGYTENNLKMPIVKYSEKDLNFFAEYIKKERSKENNNIWDLYKSTFAKTDKILSQNKFDIILDGLNVGFTNECLFSINFEKLLKNLDLKKKYLITFRSHFYFKEQVFFDKLKEKLDYEFLFTNGMLDDDIFVLYSALKNDAYIMSNDEFTNHIAFFGNYSYMFRNWFKSKQIKFEKLNSFKILHPPNFYHFTQEIEKNKWIVPYFSKDKKNSQFNSFDLPDIFVCVEKNK